MTQTERLYELLSDGRPHRTDVIVPIVYPSANVCFYCGRGDMKSLARLGARIGDLMNGKWPGKIKCQFLDESGNPVSSAKGAPKGWHDHDNPKLYWYRMLAEPKVRAPETIYAPTVPLNETNHPPLFA